VATVWKSGAYPGEKSNLAEHLARDAFLSALSDPEFEVRIREKEPADLDTKNTAVKYAQRYEISKDIVDATTGVQPRYRSVRQVVEDQQDVSADLHELATRVTAVEQQLQPAAIEPGR